MRVRRPEQPGRPQEKPQRGRVMSVEPVFCPAIIACMQEGRAPTADDIRQVSRRIREQAFPGRPIDRALGHMLEVAAQRALSGLEAAL